MYSCGNNYKTVRDFNNFEKNNKKKVQNISLGLDNLDYLKQYDIKKPVQNNNSSNKIQPKKTQTSLPTSQIQMKYKTINANISSPEIFGPPMWFGWHSGSLKYSDNPSPITKDRMKNYILGLPVMIPCLSCREHATSFIDSSNLDDVTSSKTKLFNFFVDMHNFVNKRLNKPIMSHEDAYKLYNNASVTKISYS